MFRGSFEGSLAQQTCKCIQHKPRGALHTHWLTRFSLFLNALFLPYTYITRPILTSRPPSSATRIYFSPLSPRLHLLFAPFFSPHLALFITRAFHGARFSILPRLFSRLPSSSPSPPPPQLLWCTARAQVNDSSGRGCKNIYIHNTPRQYLGPLSRWPGWFKGCTSPNHSILACMRVDSAHTGESDITITYRYRRDL